MPRRSRTGGGGGKTRRRWLRLDSMGHEEAAASLVPIGMEPSPVLCGQPWALFWVTRLKRNVGKLEGVRGGGQEGLKTHVPQGQDSSWELCPSTSVCQGLWGAGGFRKGGSHPPADPPGFTLSTFVCYFLFPLSLFIFFAGHLNVSCRHEGSFPRNTSVCVSLGQPVLNRAGFKLFLL